VCGAGARKAVVGVEREVVMGITSLGNRLYVLRNRATNQVEVEDINSSHLLHHLTVPGLRGGVDIVACAHNCCIYVLDVSSNCVHRLALSHAALTQRPLYTALGLPRLAVSGTVVTQWPVHDKPSSLSLAVTHSILVTCREVRKIKEFSTDGQLLREVVLPDDVVGLAHSVQLPSGEFVVCHGGRADAVHRVCLVSPDGHVVKSYGGPKGSSTLCQMSMPIRLAVDSSGFVFVVDYHNRRVLLLSPLLHYVRTVVSHEEFKSRPLALHLHVGGNRARRLFVADNHHKDGRWTTGRVVVFTM